MTPEQAETIPTFFFFALLDEKLAAKASRVTIALVNRKAKQPEMTLPTLVESCQRYFKKYKKRVSPLKAVTFNRGWSLPDTIDLGPWKQFHQDAVEDEVLAVIWIHILELPSDQVGLGLGVSPGTINYRAGQGLARLGKLVRPGVGNA